MDSIPKLMLQDHAEIFKLLREFEEGRKGAIKEVARLFDRFQWKLEKHILIEERVIFGYTFFSRESSAMVQRVLDDHKIILEMLRSIQKSFMAGSFDGDISDLKRVIEDHRNFEDEELYPKLDQELNAKAKQFIVEQLKTRLF